LQRKKGKEEQKERKKKKEKENERKKNNKSKSKFVKIIKNYIFKIIVIRINSLTKDPKSR